MKHLIYFLLILSSLSFISCEKESFTTNNSIEIKPSKDVTELTVYVLGQVARLGYIDIISMTDKVTYNNKSIPFAKSGYSIYVYNKDVFGEDDKPINGEALIYFLNRTDTIAYSTSNIGNDRSLLFYNHK